MNLFFSHIEQTDVTQQTGVNGHMPLFLQQQPTPPLLASPTVVPPPFLPPPVQPTACVYCPALQLQTAQPIPLPPPQLQSMQTQNTISFVDTPLVMCFDFYFYVFFL